MSKTVEPATRDTEQHPANRVEPSQAWTASPSMGEDALFWRQEIIDEAIEKAKEQGIEGEVMQHFLDERATLEMALVEVMAAEDDLIKAQ